MSKARPADLDMPVALDVHPGCVSEWHLAIENVLASPVASDGEWDNSDWDTDDALWVEGGTATTFFDVIGDAQGFTLQAGRSDVNSDMEAATLAVTLDNTTGRYTQFDDAGTLHSYMPGRRVRLWVEHEGVVYPRFAGVVEVWEENVPVEGPPTVQVSCVDNFIELNAPRDSTVYRLGSEGQWPAERINSLLALVGYTEPTRLDFGYTSLRSIESTFSILEELHTTARSDGGLIFIDTDGTLFYAGRDRVIGRTDAPGHPSFPAFSDICPLPPLTFPVWTADPVTDVDGIWNVIRLKNNPDGIEVSAQNDVSIDLIGARRLSLDGLLWRSVAEGQALANFILDWRSHGYFQIAEMTLYPGEANPELWPWVYDLRLMDRVTITRTLPNGAVVTFYALIEGFRMDVTAGGGVTATYSTTQAVQ